MRTYVFIPKKDINAFNVITSAFRVLNIQRRLSLWKLPKAFKKSRILVVFDCENSFETHKHVKTLVSLGKTSRAYFLNNVHS